APDSRFCGGCGARLGATGPRVAPTQKISDDASFPQRPASTPPAQAGAPSSVARLPPTPHAPGGPPIVTTQPGLTPPRPINAPIASAPLAAAPSSRPPSAPVIAASSPRPASAPPYPHSSG